MELIIGTKFTFKGKTYIVSEDDQACTYCDLNQGNCLAAKHRDIIGNCNMISRKDQKNVVFKEIENMEKEINIAEILKNKPKGTKLYSPICGEVTFDKIERDLGHDTIFVTTPAQAHHTFMEDGKYERNGECLLFPSKEMQSWAKFAWKEGDVLVCKKPFTTVLFDGFANEEYTEINTAYSYEGDTKEYYRENIYPTEGFFKVGEGDKLRFIAYLEKEYKGKLNPETLEIEKTKAVFKDGDILYIQSFDFEYIVIFCSHNPNSDYKDEYAAYVSLSNREICYEEIHDVVDYNSTKMVRLALENEKQQLFDALANEGKRWNAETKQIEDIKPKWTPKPFEKVLVRDWDTQCWRCDFFSHMGEDNDYRCISTIWEQCIPYNEETAKLIGTTKSLEDLK